MSSPTPTKPDTDELHRRASQVELVVFDVDGVLTDGGLYFGPDGEALKRFHVRDGHGIVLARLTSLQVGLLTARTSRIVATRAAELRITHVLQGRKDKLAGLGELLAQAKVPADRTAYMGDDLNDLSPMAAVLLPCCPSDASAEVRQQALFIARQAGGHGAARELLELVLKATGRWDRALQFMKEPTLSGRET